MFLHTSITRASYLVAGLAPRLAFLCFSYAFPKVLFTSRFNDTCATICRHLRRGPLTSSMTSSIRTWWLAWPPALLSYAFPMLFLRFYSLPGAMIPESRFAAYCAAATRL